MKLHVRVHQLLSCWTSCKGTRLYSTGQLHVFNMYMYVVYVCMYVSMYNIYQRTQKLTIPILNCYPSHDVAEHDSDLLLD